MTILLSARTGAPFKRPTHSRERRTGPLLFVGPATPPASSGCYFSDMARCGAIPQNLGIVSANTSRLRVRTIYCHQRWLGRFQQPEIEMPNHESQLNRWHLTNPCLGKSERRIGQVHQRDPLKLPDRVALSICPTWNEDCCSL